MIIHSIHFLYIFAATFFIRDYSMGINILSDRCKTISHRFVICITAATLFMSCSKHNTDSRLLRIQQTVSDAPEKALASLDSINPSQLSEADRHFYDFLTIKARDKAYIYHKSDSLILSVIDYYKGYDLYPEALYYGGRTYSDLGDYPTALRYFQKALDLLPSNTSDRELRNRVLSQTGGLLSRIGLDNQSLPYLKESLKLTKERGDTLNLPYEYNTLGCAYMALEQFDTAKILFEKGYRLSLNMDSADINYFRGELAIINFKQGNVEEAVSLIKDVPYKTYSYDSNYFSAWAKDIYLRAGMIDSALVHARRIIHNQSPDSRALGYRTLLSDSLIAFSPHDSIPAYITEYLSSVKALYKSYDNKSAIIQNSLYNYSLHQHESERLAKERGRLIIWLAVAGIIILVLAIVTILRQRILLKKQAKLHSALITISELNNKLKGFEDNDYISSADTTEGILERVNNEISKLRETISRFSTPHNYAPDTEAYRALCDLLERGGMLKENDPLWNTISKSINEMSPDFEETLKRISHNKISMRDYRLVQLIKLGLSSSQIARLIGRSKSVIPYRRKQLCINSFNNLIQPDELNALIRNI